MEQEINLAQVFYPHLEENQVKYLVYVSRRLGFANDELLGRLIVDTYRVIRDHLFNKKWVSYGRNGWVNYHEYSERDFAFETYRIFLREFSFKKVQVQDKFVRDSSGNEVLYKGIREKIGVFKRENYVSATDISGFAFCPVSLSIKKTFEIDEVSEETKAGVEMHEDHRLVNLVSGRNAVLGSSATSNSLYNKYNFEFFDDVRTSKIVYVGHSEEKKKYFKSKRGAYVGQPDYVFQNKLGNNYIVEEKFRKLDKSNAFRNHHQLQLASYILGIDEVSASYGYLVYWYYSYEDGKRILKKCNVLKLDPGDNDKESVKKVYREIMALKSGTEVSFNIRELDTRKCASCLFRKYCGHKTGRFDRVRMPYGEEYYKLLS